MKERFQKFLTLIWIILFVYFIINILHLSWYIASPEGFWGFSYFIQVIRAVLLVLILIVISVFAIWLFVSALISLLKKKSTVNDLIKTLGVIIFIIVITAFNSVWAGSFSFFLSSHLSEKYSLINRTDEYLNKDKFEKAYKLAVKSYDNEQNRNVGWFFILSKLYSQTDFDKKQKLLSKYKATINYGYCLKETLNEDNGEKFFKESILIAKSPLLIEQQTNLLIFPTLSLAEINLNRQNFKVADNYFDNFYDLIRDSDSEDTNQIINTYLIFAEQASRVGDFKKSTKLQMESLNIYEKSDLSKKSNKYLALLLGASASELYNENFTNASNLLLKSKSIAEDKDNRPIYLTYLNVKAQYCLLAGMNNQGDENIIEKSFKEKIFGSSIDDLSLQEKMIKESEQCFKDLVKKSKDISGKNSYNYLDSLIKLGNFYYLTSQFEMAKNIFDKTLDLIEPVKHDNKEVYHDIYIKNLKIKSLKQRIDISKLDEFENFLFDNLNSNYLMLTEEEKEKYIFHLNKKFDFINDFYVKENSELARERLYNNIISVKNVALSSNSALRDYIRNSNNEIKSSFNELLNEKNKMSMSSANYNSNIKTAELIKIKEKKLLEKVYKDPTFKQYLPKYIDWKQIRDSLHHNEVAIEIFNLTISKYPKQNSQYYALLIEPDSKSPQLIELFKEDELKDLLNVGGDTKTRVNSIYNLNNKKLFNLVFAPIEKYLKEDSKIYLSKSGILHNISIPALTKNKRWNVYVLGNTRQITSQNDLRKTDKAVLFGDIDYTSSSDSISDRNRSNNFFKYTYKSLKYTKDEVEKIGELFLNHEEKNLKIHTGIEASEQAFRNISGTETDIIHLATHGYYYNSNNFSLFNDSQFETTSLLRSGLLLAGINNYGLNTPENDGNLTSLEISAMDFSNVDLIVLSACETGLGDVLGSEGVFGLQRAFKIAGAKAMIVSLWQVPDKQTSDLMFKFYSYYLNGQSKYEALRNAQKDLKVDYPDPYYWGAFELIE
ncbi:CHAT domain-containing protein [Gelidibacter japonicus]|uniref:CHAT domain-containing protein n=1 Tax=Gelidibacter japonicus TaxID=1962232 RepID=UPI002AFDE2D8|nr:CHAT domain-containing protein [Gelidibacter japonicus]